MSGLRRQLARAQTKKARRIGKEILRKNPEAAHDFDLFRFMYDVKTGKLKEEDGRECST